VGSLQSIGTQHSWIFVTAIFIVALGTGIVLFVCLFFFFFDLISSLLWFSDFEVD
jgi:hypothetical protein